MCRESPRAALQFTNYTERFLTAIASAAALRRHMCRDTLRAEISRARQESRKHCSHRVQLLVYLYIYILDNNFTGNSSIGPLCTPALAALRRAAMTHASLYIYIKLLWMPARQGSPPTICTTPTRLMTSKISLSSPPLGDCFDLAPCADKTTRRWRASEREKATKKKEQERLVVCLCAFVCATSAGLEICIGSGR